MLVAFYFVLHLIVKVECVMSPKVVGGDYADIAQFPYVAYLDIKCVDDSWETSYHSCGASILNQRVLLSVAHCVVDCTYESYIVTSVGSCVKGKGIHNSVSSYVIHEHYEKTHSAYDIALLSLRKALKLMSTVNRVAIMKNPPFTSDKARIAGWGLTCELKYESTDKLKHLDQYLWEKNECVTKMKGVPKGTFCAASKAKGHYPSLGDSGSALVVQGYIQLGIVSFKKPTINRNVIIYTDVGYFYDWIEKNSKRMFCDEPLK